MDTEIKMMTEKATFLLSAEEMSEADQRTSRVLGIPSIVLMERAALAVAEEIRRDFPEPSSHARIAVVAGKGNNGADALAVGRLLLDAGYEIGFFTVWKDENPAEKSGRKFLNTSQNADVAENESTASVKAPAMQEDSPWNADFAARQQQRILTAYGQELRPVWESGKEGGDSSSLEDWMPDAIVDGIFGTGLSRRVEGAAAQVIGLLNRLHREKCVRVFAVDIPSGVSATTGEILGCAVEADVTVTFSYYKRGHFLYPGCDHCGRLVRREIGITARSFPDGMDHPFLNETGLSSPDGTSSAFPEVFTYRDRMAEELLPARSSSGNKGTFGKILVIAGSRGVSGACTMCAGAALRMGAGMVRIFTQEENRVILQKTVPEAMCSTYPSGRELSGEEKEKTKQELLQCLAWADVAAIGPGMGKTEGCKELLSLVLEKAPEKLRGLVIDADAIRLLAEDPEMYEELKKAGSSLPVILTPHPAECAALFHKSLKEVQENRFVWLSDFARRYSCTIAGKDARTLVASWEVQRQYLNTSGNDGLATAGSGDVLTGMTAACLALGMEGFPAACAAVYLHGRAADRLAERKSRRSILATDLLAELEKQDL